MSDRTPQPDPRYLEPYREAVRAHGPRFEALLWRSETYPSTRCQVLAQAVRPKGRVVADLGAGRGDLLAYLNETQQSPLNYVGIEGISELAISAKERFPESAWIVADFVRDATLFERAALQRLAQHAR